MIKSMHTINDIFPIPTGVAAILAQFPTYFRSIAWFNVILGVGYIFLQLVMLRGESKCHCENPCQTHKCSLPEKRSKFRRMMTCSNLSLISVSLYLTCCYGNRCKSYSQLTTLGINCVSLDYSIRLTTPALSRCVEPWCTLKIGI